MEDEGVYFIGLDNGLHGISEKEHLCHEIAHASYAGVYSRRTPFNTVGKIERSADKWTYFKLVPVGILRERILQGYSEWEIAEDFDISDELLCQAIKYYIDVCGLKFEVAI